MILLNSLLACLLLAIILPPLGRRVLARRIVFVDLALAQIAAVGFAIGMATDGSGPLWAGGVTIIAVLFLAWLPDTTALPKEAVMGGVYAVAAALGMVVLAGLPHAEGHMQELLFGSLLGVDETALILLAVCGILSVLLVRLARQDSYRHRLFFYGGLALAVVPAIHAVGVILVFAMLLLPVLLAWRKGENGPLSQAIATAVGGALLGILLADQFDFPPSSTVVLALVAVGGVIAIARFPVREE